MAKLSAESAFFQSPRYEPSSDAFSFSRARHAELFNKADSYAAGAGFSNDPMAWSADQLQDSFIYHLNEDENNELNRATIDYAKSGRALYTMDRGSFVVPCLATRLQEMRLRLHDSPGIVVLRGFVPQSLESRNNIILLAGVSAHLSEQFGKQAAGKYVVHIKNLKDLGEEYTRVAPYSRKHLPFHTDRGDVVSMYVVTAGADGGEGTFASVAEICRRIAASAPDMVTELAKPDWPFDVPGNPNAVAPRPLLFVNNGRAEMSFSRGALTFTPSSRRSPDLPQMTPSQCEALEWLHWTAEECGIKFKYQDGDLIFFNNRRILHGRKAFEDADIASSRSHKPRHLLRLWLRDSSMAGPAPTPLQESWSKIFPAASENDSEDEAFDWPSDPISREQEAVPSRYGQGHRREI